MTYQLSQDERRAWIEALRSGKYIQTKDTLRDKTGHCCLGVLCDLKDLWTLLLQKYGRNQIGELAHAELGLTWEFARQLVQLNDGGATFEEIAQVIEDHFEVQDLSNR